MQLALALRPPATVHAAAATAAAGPRSTPDTLRSLAAMPEVGGWQHGWWLTWLLRYLNPLEVCHCVLSMCV